MFAVERRNRSADVVTDSIVEKVHDMILADQRLKVREIAEAVGLSNGTAFNILHDKFGVRKLSARCVPRLLMVDNMWVRVTTSKHCLDLFKRNPKEFMHRVITVDETSIHFYTRETKR